MVSSFYVHSQNEETETRRISNDNNKIICRRLDEMVLITQRGVTSRVASVNVHLANIIRLKYGNVLF